MRKYYAKQGYKVSIILIHVGSSCVKIIHCSRLFSNSNKNLLKVGFMDTLNKPTAYDDNDINRAARCIKAMSHPLRLKILCVLGTNSVSVQDIVDQVGTSQSNISQHLAILREKNILGSKKEANRVYYYIDDNRTLQLINMMREVFCTRH